MFANLIPVQLPNLNGTHTMPALDADHLGYRPLGTFFAVLWSDNSADFDSNCVYSSSYLLHLITWSQVFPCRHTWLIMFSFSLSKGCWNLNFFHECSITTIVLVCNEVSECVMKLNEPAEVEGSDWSSLANQWRTCVISLGTLIKANEWINSTGWFDEGDQPLYVDLVNVNI